MDDSDYIDFGLIEVNRSSFHQQIGTADIYIRFGHGAKKDKELIAGSIAAAETLLEELARDYSRDLANMRRRLANVTAGRGMDDNGANDEIPF